MDMKARVKATSEIGEVLCWADCSHEKISMYLENSVCDIPYSDIEVISIDNTTDWQQVRIQAAIAATQAFCNDKTLSCEKTAKMAVSQADALVAELKKKGGQK